MTNFLIIQLPLFQPKYKKWKKYGYTNEKERENLKEVLEESSDGYCMYCYTRIRVDGKLYANLEHAIEKSNSEKLKECIPNIGITCTCCNQSLKKVGERKRKLTPAIIRTYEKESHCSLEKRKQCTAACKALRTLQKSYHKSCEGKIILQPMGVKGEDTGQPLALQYDVLNMEFQPAVERYTYSDTEKEFIESHIKRFRLNDPVYKTKSLFEFIKNVINNGGGIPEYEYNNWIVDKFCEQIAGKPREEIVKICESIYAVLFLKV